MPSKTQAKTLEPPLNPRDVRIALAQRGLTQASLAQRVGKSLTTVNLAINHNTYPKVTAKIRALLAL